MCLTRPISGLLPHQVLMLMQLALQVCLVGETRLWQKSDLKLREDNDELSRRIAMLERPQMAAPKLVDADDGVFDQVWLASLVLLLVSSADRVCDTEQDQICTLLLPLHVEGRSSNELGASVKHRAVFCHSKR